MRYSFRISMAVVAILTVIGSGFATEDPPAADKIEAPSKVPAAGNAGKKMPMKESKPALPWADSLTKGLAQSQRDRRPILVRGEGVSCPYCRVMAKELIQPQVQQELQRWTLVAIDVDKSADEAEKLAISAIPSFRLLTSGGKVVASKEGVMSADRFVEWLKENFDKAAVEPAAELTAEGEPDSKAVFELIGLLRSRDAVIREGAIRRLRPYPDLAATPVVASLAEGSLSTRLMALELLREWQAPVGEIDPWRRTETLTEPRLKALTDWATDAKRKPLESAAELTPEDIATTRDLLDRLPLVTLPEALAIRERLARFGRLLLPEVAARIKTATTDDARERLTALRYRLVATNALVLNWPGGIDRLSATEALTRQQAADELIHRASAAEEPLLLELFSDPSPLVRELSLRALRSVGGENVGNALINLLSDPEPNVRAAVLKHLAEEPSAPFVPKIAQYVLAEKDADLVVHAIRVLRELSNEKLAIDALKKLLTHESWRVRAEAVEGLGKAAEHSSGGTAGSAAIYLALVDLLKDADGFVVSRAINVLTKADLAATIDPLVEVAKTHPELAPEVVKALSQSTKQQVRVIPLIKQFLVHENPKVRAAAIAALTKTVSGTIEEEIRAALQDADSEVRVAAASGVLAALEGQRNRFIVKAPPETTGPPPGAVMDREEMVVEPRRAGLLGGIAELFAPSPKRVVRVVRPAVAKPVPPADHNPDAPTTGKPESPANDPSQPAPPDKPEPADGTPSPSSPTSPVKADAIETAMLKLRAGKAFDKKWYDLVDLLKPFLTRERSEERVAGSLVLLALGQDQLALPVLEQTLERDQKMVSQVAGGLHWMLAADRQRFFKLILARAATLDDLQMTVYRLGQLDSPHTEEMLWTLAGDPRTDPAFADSVRDAMLQYYLNEYYYNIQNVSASKKKRAVAAVLPHSKAGTSWQRLIALAFLVPVDKEVASENAQLLMNDAQADLELRADALQIALLTTPSAAAKDLALAQLKSQVPALRSRALAYIALGRGQLPALQHGKFDLQANNLELEIETVSKGVPISPKPPEGVTEEQLIPFLESEDPQDAALAGYLLALFGHPEGLPPLMKYWQEHGRDDIRWMRLVYRAIAHLDDASHIDVLKEIFRQMVKDQYGGANQVSEFYWTIRIMTAPEILTFRKSIRTAIGIDNLNQ